MIFKMAWVLTCQRGTGAGPWRPPALISINPLIAACQWILGVRTFTGFKIGAHSATGLEQFLILPIKAAKHMPKGWIRTLPKTLHSTKVLLPK